MTLSPAPDCEALPLRFAIEPRFDDVNAFRHIGNVAILEYHQEVRIRVHLDLLGPDYLRGSGASAMIVANVNCDFLAEAHAPHPIEACWSVARIGTTSYGLRTALWQQDRCFSRAETRIVHVQGLPLRPAPFPNQIRRRLEALHKLESGEPA